MYRNTDIRQRIIAEGLYNYQVAKEMKVNPETFSKWLRYELPYEKKMKIIKAIEEIKK